MNSRSVMPGRDPGWFVSYHYYISILYRHSMGDRQVFKTLAQARAAAVQSPTQLPSQLLEEYFLGLHGFAVGAPICGTKLDAECQYHPSFFPVHYSLARVSDGQASNTAISTQA